MTFSHDLLNQAEMLAKHDINRPKQANLRRAVSAAYYALFHHLIDEACRNFMGSQSALQAYRILWLAASTTAA